MAIAKVEVAARFVAACGMFQITRALVPKVVSSETGQHRRIGDSHGQQTQTRSRWNRHNHVRWSGALAGPLITADAT